MNNPAITPLLGVRVRGALLFFDWGPDAPRIGREGEVEGVVMAVVVIGHHGQSGDLSQDSAVGLLIIGDDRILRTVNANGAEVLHTEGS